MSDVEGPTSDDGEARALRRVLERIAGLLNCPVGDFFAPEEGSPLGEIRELVRLWNSTLDGPGRSRILSVARQEAARCAAPKVAE